MSEQPYLRAGIYVRKSAGWKDKGWTAVPNAIIRHEVLSWEAKGAYAWLASHDETFALRAEDLAGAGPKGRNHAREMIRELEQHGWLSRSKHHNAETGRIDVHLYTLHPEPLPLSERTWTPSTAEKRSSFPTKEKPRSGPAPARPVAGDPAPDPAPTAEEQNPRSEPAPDRPGAGRPGPGRTGPDRPGDIEKTTREENPPTPPLRGGSEVAPPEEQPPARCAEHGRTSCRPCGTSPRAQAWAERDQDDARVAELERQGRACPLCIPDGPSSRDPRLTRWIVVRQGTRLPLTPYVVCRHDRPYRDIVEDIERAEAEAERAERERDQATPDPDSRPRTGSSAGREEVRRVLARKGPSKPKPPRKRLGRTRTFVPDGPEHLGTSENVSVGEAV